MQKVLNIYIEKLRRMLNINKFKKGLKVKSVDLKLPTMYNMYNEDGKYLGRINPSYEKMQNKWLNGITKWKYNYAT